METGVAIQSVSNQVNNLNCESLLTSTVIATAHLDLSYSE